MFRIAVFIAIFCTNAFASLDRFYNWANVHKIEIPNDEHEFLNIFTNWKNNDKIIEETNAKNLSYTLGHNAFSGMNSVEFAKFMHFDLNHEIFTPSLRGLESASYSSVPASVDWRTKGVVSEIQDQGQAGTCYSFSTTAAIETALAIKSGVLTKMSEQQIVDCSTFKNGGPNMGVNGGQIAPTFTWVQKNNGLCTEESYPYVSGTTKTTGTCQKTCSKVSGSTVSGVINVKPNSDADMMTALTQTILSIGIEADQSTFQLYKSGIFTGACGTKLDHAVALVGYTADYYILRNSWGASWGQSGYMYIGKGNDPATGTPYNGGAGQCGLLMEGSYPVM